MRSYKACIAALLVGMCLLTAQVGAQPVSVSIPDTLAPCSQTVMVPVQLAGLSGAIASAEVFVSYNGDLLTAPAIETDQTLLTPAWTVQTHVVEGVGTTTDTLMIAMATGTETLSDAGTLINLRFQTATVRRPAWSPLHLTHVLLNDGTPEAVVTDGSVRLVGVSSALESIPEVIVPRQTIQVTVGDADENRDPDVAEQRLVRVDNGLQGETVTVAETGANSGVFSGSIATVLSSASSAISGDGVVQAKAGDLVVFSFTDSLDALGNTTTRWDSTLVTGGPDTLVFTAYSPVDLIVEDPLGRTIDKSHSEVPSATYLEADLDGDGDLDDRVIIPEPLLGYYEVTVVPEPSLPEEAEYTLTAENFGVVEVLEDQAPVPPAPVTVVFDAAHIPPPIVAVSLPATTVQYNELVSVPVRVDDTTDKGIVSAELVVGFNGDLLRTPTVTTAGSLLTGDWAVATQVAEGAGTPIDTLKIAMATGGGPLYGAGTLLNLRFQVADMRHPASSALVLLQVLFNTGNPLYTGTDGFVRLLGNNGTVSSRPARVVPGQDIEVTVSEPDENRNPGVPDMLAVRVNSGGQSETVVALETGPNTGLYIGSVPTRYSLAPVSGDGMVQAGAGDRIVFSFADSLDAAGNAALRTDTTGVIGSEDGQLRVTAVAQPGDTVRVTVADRDMNSDPAVRETRRATALNVRTGETEATPLTELSADDTVFFGQVRTTAGSNGGTSNDGVMTTQRADTLIVTYVDSLTTQGGIAEVQDRTKVVNPFGDADGNGQTQAYDASRVLYHRLSPFLAGMDSLAANVDLGAPFSQITAYDAALILQKRVGRIWRFPVQEDEAANHPQPETDRSVPKPVTVDRSLGVQEAGGYLAVLADRRDGIVSGELELCGIAGRACMAPEMQGFVVASLASDKGLRIAFAGAQPVDGPGELVRVFGAALAEVRLTRACLNDGQIGVRLESNLGRGNLPRTYALYANHPNPFNPQTTVRFDLPRDSQVRLDVYDAVGQRIRVLVSGELPAGAHAVVWDGRDVVGRAVGNGVYFCRLEAGQFTKVQRMVLAK